MHRPEAARMAPPMVRKGRRGRPEGPAVGRRPADFKSVIPKNLVHDALTEESISWYGTARVGAPIEDQFIKYTFPVEGGSRIHMIWTDCPCYYDLLERLELLPKALVKPEIEFIVAQHPWLESDCYFADVILPVATKFELEDIDNDAQNGQYSIVILPEQVDRAGR